MVLNLTGFLEKESLPFVSELWKLLVSAQSSADGIPIEFKQAKLAQMASAPVSMLLCVTCVLDSLLWHGARASVLCCQHHSCDS
jgi:hypothetical protein